MKVIFNRQKISEALAPLMGVVSNKNTLSAVEGILLNAQEDGQVIMTGFDLEKGVRLTVNAEVEEPGSAIINAMKFVQTVRVMDGDTVELCVDEKLSATFISGKSSHKMVALPQKDFPEIPRLTSDASFTIGQGILKKMLAKVMYAMGTNDQRQVLNGCYFYIEGSSLRLVSCDSFKLSKCTTTADIVNTSQEGMQSLFSFVLPAKSVSEIEKMLSDDETETVQIFTSRKNIVFSLPDKIFFSRLLEGEYIDYERVIIKNHRISLVCDRMSMLAALERAALVTEEKIIGSVRAYVKITIEDDLMKISAVSSGGSTYDEVEIAHAENQNIVIAFNNRYLMESLRACTADKIKISLSTPLSSVNIEPQEQENGSEEIFMLLPVRMKD